MSKLLYKNDFNRLLSACKEAEESYRLYLIRQFGLRKDITLMNALSKVFKVSEKNNNTLYGRSLENLQHELNQKMTEDLYNQFIDKFEKIFVGERLKRTREALTKILQAEINGKKKKDADKIIEEQISYIIGNYKEWLFLVRGQKDVEKNSDKNSLFKAELVDVDNDRIDFLIKEPNSKEKMSSYGKSKMRKFQYISNGVPLDYKSSISKEFHLAKKTYNTTTIDPIVRHHIRTKNINWDKIYNSIIIDLTMMTIINKIDTGFPVFVSSNVGTEGVKFFLCSTMLESLKKLEGLQDHVINHSFYGSLEEIRTLSLEDIQRIIKKDEEIRLVIDNDIRNIRDNNDLTEDEKDLEIKKLEKKKTAESVLKKLIGPKTIVTNLFYSKAGKGGK